MPITLEKTTYADVPNCLKLSNGTIDLIITTAFGPRVLRYGFCGGQNLFKEFSEQLASPGADAPDTNGWQSYGGHRLWYAPEVYPRTYFPDNAPVPWDFDGTTLTLDCPEEACNALKKTITITLADEGTQVQLNHQLQNIGVWDVEMAAWCLTVMAAGGRAIIPQEVYIPHPDCLLPARPLALWHFTHMSDPRFTWGNKFIQMRQDDAQQSKQKIGLLNTKGWEAYDLNQEVFLKRHDCIEGATYPDMGCNAEFFTMPGFLEIESLSPLAPLAPGDKIDHRESWTLHKLTLAQDEATFGPQLEKLLD